MGRDKFKNMGKSPALEQNLTLFNNVNGIVCLDSNMYVDFGATIGEWMIVLRPKIKSD